MNADQLWSIGLKIAVPLAALGFTAFFGWLVKRFTGTSLLQKALYQLAAMMQGFASDVTSGIQAQVNAATADGVVTPAERSALVSQLVVKVKASAESEFLKTLQNLLGLQTGSALDTWLAGMAGEHIDAQLTSVTPVAAKPAITPGVIAQAAQKASTTVVNPLTGQVATNP